MQKFILIICYFVNLCVVFFGYSLLSRVSDSEEFESFTLLLFFINMFGVVEGGRPIVVSVGTRLNGVGFLFIKKLFLKQFYYAILLALFFSSLCYISYKDVMVSLLVFFSVPILMFSSLCIGGIESHQMPGTASIPKMFSMFFLFSFSVFYFSTAERSGVFFSLMLYVIVYSSLSIYIMHFFSKRSVEDRTTHIDEKILRDSFIGNFYRAYVDYLDRLFLMLFGSGAMTAVYMSRMELAQKYVNISQVISFYIFPKLCSMESKEKKWSYLKSILLPCFGAAYFFVFVINYYSSDILSIYFHDNNPVGNDVFVIFTCSFMFNFTSFFFVPYLRSIQDFKTSKLTFFVSSLILTISFLLLLGLGLITLNNVAICFLLSKLPYLLNVFSSLASTNNVKSSIFYTSFLAFLKLTLLLPVVV